MTVQPAEVRLAVLESQVSDLKDATVRMENTITKQSIGIGKLVSSLNSLKWFFGLLLTSNAVGLLYIILTHGLKT